MKKIYFFTIIFIININLSCSQTTWPIFKDTLNINQVSGLIMNNSDYAWDLTNTKYFVPKNSNLSPLFAASMWLGGYHNGSLHAAAMTYRQNGVDFWPGPLDTITAIADTSTSSPLKRLWKINRFDVANFIYNWNAGNVQSGTFIPNATILNWPTHGTGAYAHNMAPFVDVNSNGIYDPINGGDYPLMRGDEMIWWVFNDNAGSHGETGGLKIGVEVYASAYAFVCPLIADSDKALNYTTFYHYDIFNRTTNKYDSTFIGLWMDTDLGNPGDDYIGCDVMNNYGFTYNGDNYDDFGYLSNLPVFACNILKGPVADIGDGIDNNNNGVIDEPNEVCLMNRFTYYTNTGNPQTGNPYNTSAGLQYYNFITSKWKNGTPMTYGGDGTSATNPPCKYMYPGMSDPYGISLGGSISNPVAPPVNNWTQYTAGVVKNDMRFLIGMGPFTMQPHSKHEVDYALVFSQDSANCYGAVDTCVLVRAKQDNLRVKNWFANNSFPSCLNLNGVGINEIKNNPVDFKIYPSPAQNYIYLEFKEPQPRTTIEIIDMLGKIVKAGVFVNVEKYIAIPIENLSRGVYTLKFKAGNDFGVKKFVKE
jgi:hypothetical protein